MTFPDFYPTRIGSDVEVKALNRDGKPMRIFRSGEHNIEILIIDTVDSDTFLDEAVSGNVAYVIQYGEFELSLNVVEDFPDAEPPYLVIEALGATELPASSFQITPSWETDPITILTTTVDPLQFGVKSSRKYTKQ